MATDLDCTPQENHDYALDGLREHLKDLRGLITKARDAAQEAVDGHNSMLRDLPETFDGMEESDVLAALVDALPFGYRRLADDIESEVDALKRRVKDLLNNLDEVMSLRDYLVAGDFRES